MHLLSKLLHKLNTSKTHRLISKKSYTSQFSRKKNDYSYSHRVLYTKNLSENMIIYLKKNHQFFIKRKNYE